MKIYFFLTALLALSACNGQADNSTAAATATDAEAPRGYINIDVAEFRERLDDPNTVLLDVRTPREWADGKIEAAIEMNVQDENFAEQLQTLDKSKTYLVYCRSGRRSATAAEIMVDNGFTSVYNLEGGYLAWTKEE